MTTIDISKLAKKLGDHRKATREAIQRGIRNGARRGRAILVRKTPKDMGALKAAWKDTVSHPGTATTAKVAEVYNDAPYAGIVENGARPHPVSREGRQAILEWARRHFPGADEEQLEGISWAIVQKIGREGQAPTSFVRDSREELTGFVGEEVERQVKRLAADEAR